MNPSQPERPVPANTTPQPSAPPHVSSRDRDLARADALARHAPDLLLVLDEDGTILYASASAEHALGRPPETLRGTAYPALVHADDAVALGNFLSAPPGVRDELPTIDVRLHHLATGWRQFEAIGTDLRAEPGVGGFLLTARDVTARRQSERRNAAFLALGQQLGAATSAEAAAQIIATVADELLGWDAYLLSLYSDDTDLLTAVLAMDLIDGQRTEVPQIFGAEAHPGPLSRRVITTGGVLLLHRELQGDAARSERFGDLDRPSASLIYVPVRAEDTVVGFLSIQSYTPNAYTDADMALLQALADHCGGALKRVRAAAALRASEAQLRHQATHDSLTGLANRALFQDLLTQALDAPDTRGDTVAVLFIDLDRFKLVNDSLGHEAGDALLVAIATRLRAALRPTDSAARFAGDEFTVLLPQFAGADDANRLAERIIGLFATPFAIAQREVVVTASVGVALGVVGRDRPVDLLRHADTALYRAKHGGRARHTLYDAAMRDVAVERLELEGELRLALDREDFQLHYQPQIALATGRMVGLEALLRWPSGTHGPLEPGTFLPLAEETGLILPLGRWVLREVCRQAQAWRTRTPHPDLTVSVNLSATEFAQPGLADMVAQTLRATGLSAAALELEIAESAIMEDPATVLTALRDLKRLGVRLTLDDFGAGYSSLRHLARFPLDTLKLDKALVAGLGRDPGDEASIRAAIGIGRALGLRVVATGVETAAQRSLLQELGCHLAQGYHLARPAPPATIDTLLTVPKPHTP